MVFIFSGAILAQKNYLKYARMYLFLNNRNRVVYMDVDNNAYAMPYACQ